MSYASQLVEQWQHRAGQPRDGDLDAYYACEWTMLRDSLSRLEVILADEGVDDGIAHRVMRCLLYGSPSPAAAEQRMRQEKEMVKLLSERPAAMHVTDVDPGALARLGLAPQ